jgi:hypothetical protein
VSFLYQDMFVKITTSVLLRLTMAISSRMVVLDVSYGITDKLAVSVGIPGSPRATSATSQHPIAWNDPTPTPLDDGTFHLDVSGLQVRRPL